MSGSDLGDFEDEVSDVTGTDGQEADGFDRMDTDPPSPQGLGVVCAGDGIEVGDDPRLKAYVTVGNREGIRVGRYLVVTYPDDEVLLTRIGGLRYAQQFDTDDANEIQARRAMKSDGVDEADYKFIASLEAVAVVSGDDRRMPDRVPKPNASVERATDKGAMKTGLDIPSDGVFVGHLAVGGRKVRTSASPPTIDYRLHDDYGDAEPLVFRHTLIAGGTGSGKSHNAKNVLRQFLGSRYRVDGARRRPAVVVFDPQNEYAQMHDDPDVDDETKRRWEAEGVEYGGYEDTTAFVPDVDGFDYDANHRAPQIEFSVPFEMADENPWLLAGAELSEQQTMVLRTLLTDYFRAADEPTYEDFSDFVMDPANAEEYIETGRAHEATYNALKRKVAENPIFSRVFDQPAPPVTDDEILDRFVRPGALSVVPTYHVTKSRAEEVVVLALASLLVDNKLSTGGRENIKETPLVLALDEAHNFLADTDTAQGRVIKGRFAEAAKQGRKERLGLFLITQDPGDIADPVFKQVNTRIALNLGDEDAIRSLNIPSELEDRVPYMGKGEMVVYSPDNSEPVEVVGLPDAVTRHD
ncbi:ATP-binding protein [Haladaptatus sp. F3-133]|jgi:DNA helicase HerA-like ATPase|uniref:ATP-binding protein n=1 Tax=Halorutilus salinus TaxID=2487751 RepID=A0A9Q4C462_9EURY|nr:ATP-binding protein [Halorutilus salinus]MCX2818665.1 ATP-binding protein [Halorutilus salinus]